MVEVADEIVGGLLWYAECRHLALQQIQEFRPAADLQAMRLSYGLYLMHLHSLLDLAFEVDPEVTPRWRAELECGGLSGANNASFLREFRNSIVHRGEDATVRGTIVTGHICAVAPARVWGREGRRGRAGPFRAFEPLLWNMFVLVEEALPRTLKPLVERIELQLLNHDPTTDRATYMEALATDDFMPDWAKGMAHELAEQIPFDQIAAHRFSEIQRLLGRPGAISRLELDAEQSMKTADRHKYDRQRGSA